MSLRSWTHGLLTAAALTTSLSTPGAAQMAALAPTVTEVSATAVKYGALDVDGLRIAYREAGNPSAPKLVLLPGFPASSHQYRLLLPLLADRFHVLAPDYQGFGYSEMPDPNKYSYTFDALATTMEKFLAAKGFEHYGLYAQDYGGPVGFRVVSRNPQALDWLIVQNTNAYEEGFTRAWDGLRGALWKARNAETEKPLEGFFSLDGIKGIYLHGAAHPELVSPDNWELDSALMQRPGAVRMHLDLLYDYRKNVALYPVWQKLLRERQPKTVIFWGENDPFFSPAGGEAYLRDLPKAEIHRLNAGHFAVEDNADYIASHMKAFFDANVATSQ